MLALCEIELFLPAANSLKAKRQIIRSLIGRIRARCNASVAETGHQDVWQRTRISVALVGSDRGVVDGQIEIIRRLADSLDGSEVASFRVEEY